MSITIESISARIFLRKPSALAGLAILALLYLIAIIIVVDPHLLTHYNPDALNFADANRPPSLTHLFGTDAYGRDIFTRVLYALPLDSAIPFAIVGFGVVLGTTLGTIAGYFGGFAEEVILRVTDVFFAFPSIILALAIASILGQGAQSERVYYSILALMVVSWPFYTRLARAQILVLRNAPFVKFAELSGHGSVYTMRKHILPHITPIIVAYASLDMGTTLLTYSVFAFFGLGAQPPTPELGRMVYSGLSTLPGNWWWSLFPGIILTLFALGYSLVGEALRDVLDPRLRGTT
ncbi:MAG: ABC transporter permease [Thermoprotei archaeon]